MATKLKNLEVTKVDFVDKGANPDADIKLFKRRNKDSAEPEANSAREKGSQKMLKKLFAFIGKAAGMNQEEIDSAADAIQKGDAVSFNEKIDEANFRKIADEIWDMCYALQGSLCSILNDEELDEAGAEKAMHGSLNEFLAAMQTAITKWAEGRAAGIVKRNTELSEADLNMMKSAVEKLNASIEKACVEMEHVEKSAEVKPLSSGKEKGDEKKMDIDKSKLTDAERAFLESIEKRYGTEEKPAGGTPATEEPAAPSVEKAAPQAKTPAQPQISEQQPAGDEGIYKGLHPAVKAELEGLKKFREAAEEKELGQVAKKYEIIGKKPEELVPMFKSLKAAGGTAYDDMIAVLDQAVETVEKSGAFSEIGKSGHGAAGAAENKIESIAKSYMEKDASLEYTAALAKAWEDNPELMAEYEEEAGF